MWSEEAFEEEEMAAGTVGGGVGREQKRLEAAREDMTREALKDALRELTRDGVPCCPDGSSEDQEMPTVYIEDPVALQRLQHLDKLSQRMLEIQRQKEAADWLTCMFYNTTDMHHRYGQMNHIRRLVLFQNENSPASDRLPPQVLRSVAVLCLPKNWWSEMEAAFGDSWCDYEAYLHSGGEQWEPEKPCKMKKYEEDFFILWAIVNLTAVRNWYFSVNGERGPIIAEPVRQEQFLLRGHDAHMPESIAVLLQKAIRGEYSLPGLATVVSRAHSKYSIYIKV